MKFLTEVEFPKPAKRFEHSNKFACLGSCFADEIGYQLHERLFDCLSNPLGTLFNPIALAELIDRSLEERAFEPSEFFYHQELWRHFLIHSSIASPTLETSVAAANNSLRQLGQQLRSCDLLILTLGSAWIYESQQRNGIVGHNHKLPLEQFNKRLLSPGDIEQALKPSLSRIRKAAQHTQICITVSPVRHLRDGLHENNLSKASLLLAAHSLQTEFQDVEYFPAYEILLDELRDYRFYGEDLSHPNQQAIQYIWERFSEAYLNPACLQICKKIHNIDTALSHRPHHIETQQYQLFKGEIETKISALETTGVDCFRLREKWNRLP